MNDIETRGETKLKRVGVDSLKLVLTS